MKPIKNLKVLIILFVMLSFSAVGYCIESPTRTYYNNKVPYAAFFQENNTNQLKVQVRTRDGKKVQAEIPVVNDAEKDKTQEKSE